MEVYGEAPPTVEARAYMALESHVLSSDEWVALYDERRKGYIDTDEEEAVQ